MNTEELNQQFAIRDQLRFEAGVNGLTRAVIHNDASSAEVYLHGGHITAFHPHGQSPVLWMSNLAQFKPDKAIRGGVPIVWPWFGAHPTDSTKPQHGFARISEWNVAESSAPSNTESRLQLRMNSSPETEALWPHQFELSYTITVTESLSLKLTTRNTGTDAFEVGCALHSYFAIGDIARTTITGLDGRSYLDQLDGMQNKLQSGAVIIGDEVDRIYRDTEDECVVHDKAIDRDIHVAKSGSRSTVVWNPWISKAQRMSDFPDDGYRTMICVETTNAAEDIRTVNPGESHSIVQMISCHSSPSKTVN